MIYHKPGCRYVKRMKGQNKLSITKSMARDEGYHICRYCNSMNHHFQNECSEMEFFNKYKNKEFRKIDGILYVKTEIGCWKLVYIRGEEKIAIYHRNATDKELDFGHPECEHYHLQANKQYCPTIGGFLDYIHKHDQYKATILRGEKVTHFSSKKYAKREARAQQKRKRKRVDYLFGLLDKQNEGYKELAFC